MKCNILLASCRAGSLSYLVQWSEYFLLKAGLKVISSVNQLCLQGSCNWISAHKVGSFRNSMILKKLSTRLYSIEDSNPTIFKLAWCIASQSMLLDINVL